MATSPGHLPLHSGCQEHSHLLGSPCTPLLSSTSPFGAVPSVWLHPLPLPPAPTYNPHTLHISLCSHLGTWLRCVYLREAALAQVCVCKTPHLCSLVLSSCVLSALPARRPGGQKARTAHPACWVLSPTPRGLWPRRAAGTGQKPANTVPALGQGSVGVADTDIRTP